MQTVESENNNKTGENGAEEENSVIYLQNKSFCRRGEKKQVKEFGPDVLDLIQ